MDQGESGPGGKGTGCTEKFEIVRLLEDMSVGDYCGRFLKLGFQRRAGRSGVGDRYGGDDAQRLRKENMALVCVLWGMLARAGRAETTKIPVRWRYVSRYVQGTGISLYFRS